MKKRLLGILLFVCLLTLSLTACKKSDKEIDTPENVSISESSAVSWDEVNKTDNLNESEPSATIILKNEGPAEPLKDEYIELALNVYYNDGSCAYYSRENGESIFVSEEGTYTLTFDCDKHLSYAAKSAGVSYLNNLTAVYLLDMGSLNNNKSKLTACDIKYDALYADGKALTIKNMEPKSAFKSTKIFDTNDPINGWDGSVIEEVLADENHAVNFTTVTNPKTISLTFTLSNLKWGEDVVSKEDTLAKENNQGKDTASIKYSEMDFTEMSSLELSKLMGNGINLGNTFEATNGSRNLSVSVYEGAWGQPTTTKEMIEGMKAMGFDTIRIPVAWCNTMDFANDDFEINKDYLERVSEVVDYALASEMFVIINDHWDSGWYSIFGSKNEEDVMLGWKVYETMWTQVATYFKDYSDMLIFEAANEELGNSLNDNSHWISSGYLTKDGLYETTNAINQKFVDVVRSTGGNNDDRFLLIAGYNTDIEMTCDSRFKMPTDTATNKLFLSVHYYTPSNYCLAGSNGNYSKWGIQRDYELMDSLLKKLSKFTQNGYGVIIGEYGALPVYSEGKENLQNNTIEYTTYFLDNCDVYGYVPLLWDTGSSYDKKTKKMLDISLETLFTGRSYEAELTAGDDYLTKVKMDIENRHNSAPDMWEGVETYEAGTNIAWIMWNGGAGTYSVGDTFNPADNTEGIKATNALITGAGNYSVSLDFEGQNDGLTFAALGISDGEIAFPNCIIQITSITVDGTPLKLTAQPYTNSDDKKCTRVNLYNSWVTEVPASSRALSPLSVTSPCIIDTTSLVGIKNITVNFSLIIK